MEERRPIYTFEPEPTQSFSIGGRLIFALLVFLGVPVLLAIWFGSRGNYVPPVSQSPAPVPWQATLIAPRSVPCPSDYRNSKGDKFDRCVALDLPGSGAWVRRVNLPGTGAAPVIANVQARGCNGQVYSLATGGNQLDGSCGYLDYRVTDGTPKTIVEGYNAVAPPQAVTAPETSDWQKGFAYGRTGGVDTSCIAPAGIAKPVDWGLGCQSGGHSRDEAATQPTPSPPKVVASNPSFDCAKAASPVELIICANPDLASLDGQLGQAYEAKLAVLTGEDRKRLIEAQRHWITSRSMECGIPAHGIPSATFMVQKKPCLVNQIRNRIEAIRKT